MLDEPIVQVAYFVNDARKTALQMVEKFGAGPFHLVERIELQWAEVRGTRETPFVHTSAYGQWGGVMMELVQQDEEGPSPFREMYAPGEEGIHHVAMMVNSMAETYEECERLKLEIAARAVTSTGTEFAFIDAVKPMGHMIEIYERAPGLVGFYDLVRQASLDWNGDDPLRLMNRSRDE